MAPKKNTSTASASAPASASPPPSRSTSPAKKEEAATPVVAEGDSHIRHCISDTYAKKVLEFINTDEPTQSLNVTIKAAQTLLNGFVRMLIADTAAGRVNSITNFVTFKREVRKARDHKNPQTLDVVHVPDHYVMKVDIKPAVKNLLKALPIDPADQVAAASAVVEA